MSQHYPRRNFLTRLSLGVSSFIALPFMGFSKIKEDEKSIMNIKPLGFQWETADPFLFCVHHEDWFPKGNENMGPDCSLEGRDIGRDFMIKDGWRMYHGTTVPGFPSHPHRGFETITVVRKGMVDHADSLGAAGRYGDGDVQWMTAGKGVQHSEMFPLINKTADNPMELFQIWLNLPRKSKMVEPHYKMLWRESVPIYTHQDPDGRKTAVEIIVGSLAGHTAPTPPPDSWAFDKNNEVAVWNISMEANASFTLPQASEGVNRTIYFYEGTFITIASQRVEHYHAVEVQANHTVTIKNSGEKARLLVLQGRPIGEPVVQSGPFVMNTKQEVQQAYIDFQNTRFGGWPWPQYDQVHGNEKKRFALYANGQREDKG